MPVGLAWTDAEVAEIEADLIGLEHSEAVALVRHLGINTIRPTSFERDGRETASMGTADFRRDRLNARYKWSEEKGRFLIDGITGIG